MNGQTEVIPYRLARTAVLLAAEGVPVRAIARSTEFPSEVIREVLLDAQGCGQLVDIPREDWPALQKTEERTPQVGGTNTDDRTLIIDCTRLFGVTRLQASLLSVLIRRKEASKDMLHQVVETCRHTRLNKSDALEATDPKIVDVVVCHLRKKLKPFGLQITTLWGNGYYMTPEMRKFAQQLLGDYAASQELGDTDAEPVVE
jgi:hypothetical protein